MICRVVLFVNSQDSYPPSLPASLECLDNGHQFFQAKVAKEIERLFELDRQQALTPKKTVTVPVVGLAMAIA